jgi:hypothetical protein
MNADLVEVEEVVEETHVPVGRAPRPDMAKDFCILSGEVFGANRGHRARAHVGDAARIENRLRCAGARIEQDEDPELRGESQFVIVHEIANDLYACEIEGRLNGVPQHVEMPVRDAGFEMHPWLDDCFISSLAG